MHAFTYEMFNAFTNSKKCPTTIEDIQRHIEYLKFEYDTAIGQLNDESTVGDYKEINYLNESLSDHIRSCRLISQYQSCVNDA